MRSSISHPKNDFEGIISRNPTKFLCPSPIIMLVIIQQIILTRKMIRPTGSSSVESELNQPECQKSSGSNKYNPYVPWDDSGVVYRP